MTHNCGLNDTQLFGDTQECANYMINELELPSKHMKALKAIATSKNTRNDPELERIRTKTIIAALLTQVGQGGEDGGLTSRMEIPGLVIWACKRYSVMSLIIERSEVVEAALSVVDDEDYPDIDDDPVTEGILENSEAVIYGRTVEAMYNFGFGIAAPLFLGESFSFQRKISDNLIQTGSPFGFEVLGANSDEEKSEADIVGFQVNHFDSDELRTLALITAEVAESDDLEKVVEDICTNMSVDEDEIDFPATFVDIEEININALLDIAQALHENYGPVIAICHDQEHLAAFEAFLLEHLGAEVEGEADCDSCADEACGGCQCGNR